MKKQRFTTRLKAAYLTGLAERRLDFSIDVAKRLCIWLVVGNSSGLVLLASTIDRPAEVNVLLGVISALSFLLGLASAIVGIVTIGLLAISLWATFSKGLGVSDRWLKVEEEIARLKQEGPPTNIFDSRVKEIGQNVESLDTFEPSYDNDKFLLKITIFSFCASAILFSAGILCTLLLLAGG